MTRTVPLGLLDQHGRRATDLRVSLTDKCNLRCTYCMPAEGLSWLPKPELLTDAEIVRLVRIAVGELGVRSVRFTGGEPLLRPTLPELIARTAAIGAEVGERLDLALTTNGIGLGRIAPALREAGLRRLNVSLDTLDRERFAQMTRRDRLGDVLAGLAAAQEAGLTPVKVNAVLIRGVNDTEAPALLRFCLERGYELRFIEQMPIDADHQWSRDHLVTAEEILASLAGSFTLTPAVEARGSAPAERWTVDGGPATVGVIASVTRPFCRACNRTRLTADGQVRNCLFATGETDLRGLLRGGASDDEIADRWRAAMWPKAAARGIAEGEAAAETGFAEPSRSMSAIGG
ncbi:GTP 3',8-cyclase MoaA [Nocardioides sp.]|uniref:GTP 3',8-cyclase MoaA n=1 Tax=Nocardioides sp. TaxID=35761 RepID=UPI00261E0C29|nr:GTP 3',8-cyclase MoaA [Nocardioides sp.]